MFDGGGDHVLGGFAGTHSQEWLCHNSKDGVVVGFGATAGEDDFLGAGADQSSDLLAGRFDRAARTLAWRVDGSSIGKFAREIRHHGIERFRLDRRRGVVIEVDAVHGDASG